MMHKMEIRKKGNTKQLKKYPDFGMYCFPAKFHLRFLNITYLSFKMVLLSAVSVTDEQVTKCS